MSLFLLCANGKEVMLSPEEFESDIENPVLYFLDGEDSIKKTQTADISFKINEEVHTVKINKEIKKLWFGNFKEEQEYVDFKSISNLEEFVKLNEIKFNGFNDVSLSELKTSVPVKLSYNFCDVISNLRQLLYKNTNIKGIKVLTD